VNERESYIAFNMLDRVGPVTVRRLIDEYGSALSAFNERYSDSSVDWEGEIERVNSMGARIVTQIDPEYPSQLLEIHDPPLALYVLGRIEEGDKHSMAVVGTRRPSHYGRETAGRLSGQLSRSGMTIVSGLAEGVDTAAHEAALEAKGRTIAVLGSALDCLFPKSNKDLAQRIAKHGAVLCVFPLGRHPD
jgi:DNA processing protein